MGNLLSFTSTKNKRISFFAVFTLYLLATIIWGYYRTGTWDDDANTRYFLVMDADKNPSTFFNAWVRPFYAILFYYPQHLLGKVGVIGMMTLLNGIAAWCLYKFGEDKEYEHPWVLAAAYLFQTFLFGISRDAMTEPLAAFLIAISIYLLHKKQFVAFAIAGSFIPLARAELVFLLLFWLIALIKNRKFFVIPLLGFGLFVWWLGLYIQTGNFWAIYKELTASGEKANRYQRVPITQYISKMAYVVGPIFCYFLWIGVIQGAKKWKENYFYYSQFLAGLLLYTLFATVLDIGQSAGFLRNIITLAPFAAIIIYDGLIYVVTTITKKKENNIISAKAPLKNEPTPKKYIISPTVFLILYSLIFFVISLKEYSQKLEFRQFYSPTEKDYLLIYFIGGLLLLVLIFALIKPKKWLILVSVLSLQLGFTFYFEHPQSHDNHERVGLRETSNYVKTINKENKKVYCNHAWYNWLNDIKNSDTVKMGRLDSASLNKIKYGELVVWESHYNNKNYTNLSVDSILARKDFVLVYHSITDQNFISSVFIKDTLKQKIFDTYLSNANFETQKPQVVAKAMFQYMLQRNVLEAEKTLAPFIRYEDKNALAFQFRGILRLTLNRKNEGCADLSYAAELGSQSALEIFNKNCR